MSLQTIYGKKFGKLIFNEILQFFIENELVSLNQSRFTPGAFCIN